MSGSSCPDYPGDNPQSVEVAHVSRLTDDEASLRHLLDATLTSKGYRVVTAANGLEAIDYLSHMSNPVDVVLLDLNMPGANGVDVFKVIRLGRPNIKVLILSGNLTREARLELQGLGQNNFIQKPYALDDVGRHLRALIDKK